MVAGDGLAGKENMVDGAGNYGCAKGVQQNRAVYAEAASSGLNQKSTAQYAGKQKDRHDHKKGLGVLPDDNKAVCDKGNDQGMENG